NNLTFGTTGYVINGTNNTSILSLDGTTPTIAVGSAMTATINAVISGSDVTFSSGANTSVLILGGENQLSGTFTMAGTGGTVTITNAGAVNGPTNNGLSSAGVKLTVSNSTLNLFNDGAGGTGAGSIIYGNNITFGNGGGSIYTLNVG